MADHYGSGKSDPKKQAIALKYDKEHKPAPHVVATGKGYVAEQLIAIAEENGVTIHKDAELTQILSTLDVDSIIPIEAYAAVAEILGYIYRSGKKQL